MLAGRVDDSNFKAEILSLFYEGQSQNAMKAMYRGKACTAGARYYLALQLLTVDQEARGAGAHEL